MHPEAEFLDVIGTKPLRFFLLLFTITYYSILTDFTLLPPLSEGGLKLVCNVNIA